MRLKTLLVFLLLSIYGFSNPISKVPFGAAIFRDQKPITGKIINEKGEPLRGVSVIIKGKAIGTVTDENGRFIIQSNEGEELEFSIIGYQTISVRIGKNDLANIIMRLGGTPENEVVVVGYGTQKRINLTGAVTQIKGSEIESRMTPNVLSSLQGLVPNLNLTTTVRGGEPGADPAFDLRGPGSLSGGSPFVLVDGIPQDLNSINANDIESISVLKDASASAIYGVRAAYGVILVTTKKGIPGSKPKISYSGNVAAQTPTKLPDVASSPDFAKIVNDGYENAGLPHMFSDEIIAKMHQWIEQPGSLPATEVNPDNPRLWKQTYANTDFYDVFFKDYGFNQDHNLNVSGGGQAMTYFLSGGYYNQGSQFTYGDEYYKRLSLTANISTQVTNWLKIGLNSKFTKRKYQMPHVYPGIGDYYHDIPRRWPFYPLYDANGHYHYNVNDVALMQNGGRNITNQNQFLNSFLAQIDITKNWKINADVNLRQNYNTNTDHAKAVPIYFTDGLPVNDAYSVPNGISSYSSVNVFNSNNIYTSYDLRLNKHNFRFLAGMQTELNKLDSNSLSRTQLITDNVPFVTTATGDIQAGGGKGEWGTVGIFGRVNYDYDEKFLFEFSSRYDGTSRFRKDRRWGFFPSFSAGYNIAKENFWNNIARTIPMLKLRASYGTLGNQSISSSFYPYLSNMGINTNLDWVMGSTRPIYITAPGLVSPDLTWETATTLNFGLDAEALENKLSLTFDWYQRDTKDMFGPLQSYPAVLGAPAPQQNTASMRTKGFELSVGYRDRAGQLGYHARFLLSDNITTITKYQNSTQVLTDYYEGMKLGNIWGLTTVGLYATDAKAAAGPDQSYYNAVWTAGDVEYKDLNGDGKINIGDNVLSDHGDLSIIGNSTPRFSYGLNLGADYKGFYIDMLWQGVAKRDLSIPGNFFWGIVGDINQSTIFEEHMDYWSPSNPNAYYPKPYLTSQSNKNRQTQSRYLQNGSYLRLKNLQLGYTFLPVMTSKLGLGTLRVYFTGENLLTFTQLMSVFDPEATIGSWGAGKLYPLAKTFSFGLNLDLK